MTNPGVEISFHFNNLTKAVQCARLYKQTPEVFSINIYDEFDVLWVWTPELGEKEMGHFATAAANRGTGSFVNAQLKQALAKNGAPFTIEAVSGPNERTFTVGKRVQKQDLYDLKISFAGPKYQEWYTTLGVNETMTLSFAVGYDSRDSVIEAIREDIKNGDMVRAIITYDPDAGQNGWYDLAPSNE